MEHEASIYRAEIAWGDVIHFAVFWTDPNAQILLLDEKLSVDEGFLCTDYRTSDVKDIMEAFQGALKSCFGVTDDEDWVRAACDGLKIEKV